MTDSYLYDSGAPLGLPADTYLYSNGGLGVLGSEVPGSGEHGPGYIYNSLNLPADASKEYYAPLGTIPDGLTITVDEYSRVTASAGDGEYVVPFTLYEFAPNVAGGSLGASSFSFNFGVVGSVINLTASSCGQSNASSTAAVSVTQGAKVINLVGASCVQSATSGIGSVGVIPAGAAGLDISKVASFRIVVFEGTGSRIVIF